MESKRIWSLYKLTSPSNKNYIGITSTTPERRWRQGKGYQGCRYINNAINKYGWDNFTKEILLTNLTKEEANKLEQYYILLFRSNEKDFGYNISSGGKASKASEETKKLMSKNRQGKNAHGWGHKPSKEAKKIVANKIQGIKRSKQTKQKLSESHSNKIYQYDKNGNFIQSFNNSLEAEKITGANHSSIRRLCLFKNKARLVHGYFWADEFINHPILIKKYINYEFDIPSKKSSMFRKIIQYNEQGVILNIYSSIKKASKYSGVVEQAITYACKIRK